MTILDKIIDRNRLELENRKRRQPLAEIMAAAEQRSDYRDFQAQLQRPATTNIIAELKKASPSLGVIREDFPVRELGKMLADNGAAALSILTEPFFFHGSLDYLRQVRKAVAIPILRKDFIFDRYQLYEAAAAGADAVLLIAAALPSKTLQELHSLANELGLAVLAEIHNREELKMVIDCGAEIIGINCRDLKTFVTDLKITEELLQLIPDNKVKVAESGIRSREDIEHLQQCGANAFLIGETVMRAENPAVALRRLLGKQ